MDQQLTTQEKGAHQILKDHIADKFKSNVFDEAFDIALKAGQEHGIDVYQIAIEKILFMAGESADLADRLLKESVFHPTQSDIAIRLAPKTIVNPKDLIV